MTPEDEPQKPPVASDVPYSAGSQVITPPPATLAAGTGAAAGSSKPADLGGITHTYDVKGRTEPDTTARPVEALLRDPLSEVARKERRSLLGISAIAILIGNTGLVPEKIENLGISFSHPERAAVLWVFMGVVVYYTLAFIIYAMNDTLSYLHAIYAGNQEIRRQRQASKPPPPPPGYSGPLPAPPVQEAPWRMVPFVPRVSLVRALFDFVVPLLIALYAIFALYGAIHTTFQPKVKQGVENGVAL